MKKLSTIFLVIITGIVMTACGGGSSDSSSDNRDTSTSTSTNTSTSTSTTPATPIQLSWKAPATRADNTYLPPNELEGYRIYYGTSATNLSMLVDLNDDNITDYTVNTLPSGNYYFAVTAYDSQGIESGFSNIINKDV